MKIIEIKNLKKTYEDNSVPVHAVNGVDLSIEEGEFTAIVGSVGFRENHVAECGWRSRRCHRRNRNHRRSGNPGTFIAKTHRFPNEKHWFCFQAYNLIPVFTAKENVEFVMHLQGAKKAHRESRSTELLKAVGLGEMMDRRPSKLSGGQQQRVAVARALASKPKFVLADEPTANLDSKSTENLLDIMEQLNKNENITFIFSTHDQRVVNKARRVVTLEDGKIKSDITKS
jgi:putative ABC transport system ATP-binding protein